MKAKLRLRSAFVAAGLILTYSQLNGCSGEKQDAAQRPKLSIEIVHSAELRPALSTLRQRFNAAKHTLIDGREVVLELRSEGALAAASGFASGEIKSTAWIAPGQAFVEYANSRTHNLGASLSECTTLFSTPVIYASGNNRANSSDQPNKSSDLFAELEFSHGSPRDSSSVLAVIQQLILTTPKSAVIDPVELLRQREQRAYRYDSSESALLEELAAAPQTDQRIVITTEQSALNFNRGRSSGVQINYPRAGSAMLDYRLCRSSGDWVTAAHRAAIDEVRAFFQLADAQAPFGELGFRTAVTTANTENTTALPKIEHALPEIQAEAATKILDGWREIRRPSTVVFVFDTSGSTDSGLLGELRAALRLSLARCASRDLRALVTFGSDAMVAAKLNSDPAKIMPVIDTLRSAGGAALYDAIKLAATELEDPRSIGSRRAIFVVTDSDDKNSSGSIEALKSVLQPMINAAQLQLVVLAIPTAGENIDQLNAFVKDIGGVLKQVQLSQTRAAFDELVASLE